MGTTTPEIAYLITVELVGPICFAVAISAAIIGVFIREVRYSSNV